MNEEDKFGSCLEIVDRQSYDSIVNLKSSNLKYVCLPLYLS